MKKRVINLLYKIKEATISLATNVTIITQELYGEDREELIEQVSKKKRRKYEIVLNIVDVIEVIVLFAINYLIMWIIWQIIMDPPFGKEKYIYPFEINNTLLSYLIVVIVFIGFMKNLVIHKPLHIYRYIRFIRYLPISCVLGLYFTDIGKSDILFQLFYLCILYSICKSLSNAIPPIVYPGLFMPQRLSRGRAVKHKDNVNQTD